MSARQFYAHLITDAPTLGKPNKHTAGARFIKAFKHSSIQAFKHSSIQAFKIMLKELSSGFNSKLRN